MSENFKRTELKADHLQQENFKPEVFMQEALVLAKEAGSQGDVPVGCVVVQGDTIVGRGRNRREQNHNAVAHAEIEAICQACATLGRWRLSDCSVYVTLEPCAMCSGAMINARVGALYFGAAEEKTGCCGTRIHLFEEGLGHRPKVYGGIMVQESLVLLEDFFKGVRQKGENSILLPQKNRQILQ